MSPDMKERLLEAFLAGSQCIKELGIMTYADASVQFDRWLDSKKPAKQMYNCLKCKSPTAEKQPDICGWDGYCSNCGTIGQSEVGEAAHVHKVKWP